MRPWLVEGVSAARVASERSGLWLPGAVAWLATVGWIPFLAAVATIPGEGDLAVFGAGLVTSGAWPFNVMALAAGLVAAVIAALSLLALGEVAMWRRLQPDAHRTPPMRLRSAALRLLGVELAAAGPVAFVVLGLAAALAAVAPDEFQSPDIGGGVGLRILGRIVPVLAVAIAVLLVGQALAAAAGRRILMRGQAMVTALTGGLRDLLAASPSVAGVALVSLAVSNAYLVAVWLLLRVLWAPVASQLGASGIDPSAIGLLLGLVAVWLCLVAGGAVVHAWASVWWTLTLARAGATQAVPASMQ